MTIVVALGMELLAEKSPLLTTPLDYPKCFVLSGGPSAPRAHTSPFRGPRAIRVLVDSQPANMATGEEAMPARPPFGWAATICFSMLAAASVSWVRYALSGSLGLWQDGL